VTGATGFVGTALLDHLRQHGHPVRAVVRRPTAALRSDVEAIALGDLTGPVDWTEALKDVDIVVHLAARVHVMKSEGAAALAEYRRMNVDVTARLARAAAQAGVKRFVLASSVKAVGESTAPGERFDDNTPPRPTSAYGISKLEAERALAAEAAGTAMSYTILRPPLIHGPGAGGNLARLERWIRSGIPLPFGAIDNRRSLLSLHNFCQALRVAGLHPATAGKAFLVADEPAVSTPELVRAEARRLGQPFLLVRVPGSWLRIVAIASGNLPKLERLTESLWADGSSFGTLYDAFP
jgi:nucleoside-diphosphate-sugar epimerase